jgi:hypothetical protein
MGGNGIGCKKWTHAGRSWVGGIGFLQNVFPFLRHLLHRRLHVKTPQLPAGGDETPAADWEQPAQPAAQAAARRWHENRKTPPIPPQLVSTATVCGVIAGLFGPFTVVWESLAAVEREAAAKVGWLRLFQLDVVNEPRAAEKGGDGGEHEPGGLGGRPQRGGIHDLDIIDARDGCRGGEVIEDHLA